MHNITRLFISALNHRHYWAGLITISIILHLLPAPTKLMTDDYLHYAVTTGSQTLFEKGFTNLNPDSAFQEKLSSYFDFFDASSGNLHELKQYGVVPWWTDETAKIHFYRPLGALTHWVDYTLWPHNTTLMRLENAACFILLLLAVFKFYRLWGTSTAVSLAALCYALDPSHGESILWIASRNACISTLLGVVAILAYIRWRETNVMWLYLGSLLSLLLSLLTAEAGVGAIAYMIAYAICLDKKPMLRSLTALLGPILLIVVWRMIYTSMGYGSANVAHYIDPGRDFIHFIERSLYKLPLLIGGMNMGYEYAAAKMSLKMHQEYWALCLLASITLLLLYLPVLRKDKGARFWLIGAMIALGPACAINEIAPRTYAFTAIGFFMVFAQWVQYVFGQMSLKREKVVGFVLKLLAAGALFNHIGLSLLLLVQVTLYHTYSYLDLGEIDNADKLYDHYNIADLDYAGKTVFFVNAPFTFTLQFLPYQLLYEERPIPEGLRVMAPGHTSITLERIDQHTVLVNTSGGYNIVSNHETPESCPAGITHHSRMLMGFFRKDDRDFMLGQRYDFAQSTIKVTELLDGLPLQTKWTMQLPIESDQYLFVAWDWQKEHYYPLTMPDIGRTVTIKGPFEVDTYTDLNCGSG